jgi:hypothetical protein
MGRAGKRGKAKRRRPARRSTPLGDPRDVLDDVFESGGELFLAVGYTSGGAPYGPRVEIVDGELVFPDEPQIDAEAVREWDDESPHVGDRRPPGKDSPF